MDPKSDKKGFWGGLLRRGSLAAKNPLVKKENGVDRRHSDGDALLRRRDEDGRRPRRSEPEQEPDAEWETEKEPKSEAEQSKARKTKGKRPETNGHRRMSFSPSPLTKWPPSGVLIDEQLSQQHATELICRGVPIHKGHKRPVPHVSDEFYALYATTSGNRGGETDAADVHDAMTQFMTRRMQGSGLATYPWETLEQPSYAFFHGRYPGTITLNQWASMSSVLPPRIILRDPGVLPRPLDLEQIFERLQELRAGLEDDDMNLLYKILYRRILRDPDKILNPHKTLDKQMTDLIMVLSRPHWIDFTNIKNQVVTCFIFNGGTKPAQYQKFFHQLLLSLELELRIHSRLHGSWAKEKLLQQIPPTIQWNLALARRWRQNVRIDAYGKTPGEVKLRYKLKKRQVKSLKRFAQLMKWPNLEETMESLRQKDEGFALDAISSDAFAYFSGLIVPGPTLPFLIMNTLIDLDPDPATDDLALLQPAHPECGFQYRSSYTYWTTNCIVGKVLAPTCRSVAGWIGPARPTGDLGRSQIARIRTRQPRQRLTPEDVESMTERSEPLGPKADKYPVGEYKLAKDRVEEVLDIVRFELLGLRNTATVTTDDQGKANSPRIFDAFIQFAIDGVSWPLRLLYDVSFISAWPCSGGPHPLFFDYAYTAVPADEVVNIQDWGGLYSGKGPAVEGDEEKVLVIEAFGVKDNEVLARAWCAHWGLCAVVADVRRTCMACAIREAYAGTMTVVILTEGRQDETDDL